MGHLANARPRKPAGAERIGISGSLCAHVVDPKYRKNAKIADQASKPRPMSQPQWAEGCIHLITLLYVYERRAGITSTTYVLVTPHRLLYSRWTRV
jgi:hypothetical protein